MSIDFNHDPHSAIVNGGQTRMLGARLLNLVVWFDNEWGFASRMIDVTQHWLSKVLTPDKQAVSASTASKP